MPPIASLIALVRENRHPGMVVVEVGVLQGETALAWLSIVQEEGGRGILIDHFKGNLTYTGGGPCSWDPTLARDRCDELAEKLYLAGYEGIAEIWRMSSYRGAGELEDGSCDIIFVDADHCYSAVKQDIALYLPKVKPGGILCGHDVHSLEDAGSLPAESLEVDVPSEGPCQGRHCGVDRAVWETFGVEGIEIRSDNVWVHRVERGPGA